DSKQHLFHILFDFGIKYRTNFSLRRPENPSLSAKPHIPARRPHLCFSPDKKLHLWTVEKTRALRAEVSAGIKRTPENSINMDITTVLHDFGIHSSELLTFIVAAINLVLMALAAWGAYLLVT